jgi:hypothetical protein
MPDLGRLADSIVPAVIERLRSQWVLHAVFWPSFALFAVPVTMQNGPAGAVFALSTALIVLCTAWVGLARVHTLIWLPGAAFMLFAALILGGFQSRLDRLGGWVLVVFVLFLVCVTSFGALLAAIDRARRTRLAQDPAEDLAEDPRAALRLAIMKLWIATMAMVAIQAYLTVTVCMVALVMRGRVSAVFAGICSMLLVLVKFQGGEIIFETGPFEIVAGLLAGYQWFRTAFQPWWRRWEFFRQLVR